MKKIKPGSLVLLTKYEPIIDGEELKIIGWFEDKHNKEIIAKLFTSNTVGLYLRKWNTPLADKNILVWHEVMISSKVYLFTWEQLKLI